jgi:hypothetical protein
MTTKTELIEAIQQMPDEMTAAEVIEEMAFRLHLEEGLRDIEEGRVISDEEAKRRHAKWLS